MDTKKLNFIIKHFGCYTTKDGKQVLTSLANSSRVPVKEFWNVFYGDAENYFEIWPTDGMHGLSLVLNERIRRSIEKEIMGME